VPASCSLTEADGLIFGPFRKNELSSSVASINVTASEEWTTISVQAVDIAASLKKLKYVPRKCALFSQTGVCSIDCITSGKTLLILICFEISASAQTVTAECHRSIGTKCA
jgi:hypothetical protein